jgi:hypothetical protein
MKTLMQREMTKALVRQDFADPLFALVWAGMLVLDALPQDGLK